MLIEPAACITAEEFRHDGVYNALIVIESIEEGGSSLIVKCGRINKFNERAFSFYCLVSDKGLGTLNSLHFIELGHRPVPPSNLSGSVGCRIKSILWRFHYFVPRVSSNRVRGIRRFADEWILLARWQEDYKRYRCLRHKRPLSAVLTFQRRFLGLKMVLKCLS